MGFLGQVWAKFSEFGLGVGLLGRFWVGISWDLGVPTHVFFWVQMYADNHLILKKHTQDLGCKKIGRKIEKIIKNDENTFLVDPTVHYFQNRETSMIL